MQLVPLPQLLLASQLRGQRLATVHQARKHLIAVGRHKADAILARKHPDRPCVRQIPRLALQPQISARFELADDGVDAVDMRRACDARVLD